MANKNALERNERLIQAHYRLIEKIRESEERFRTLIESLPQQIWTTLPNGKLDYANQKMCLYFDSSLIKLVDSGWEDYIHPDDKAKHDALYAEGVRTNKPYELDIRLRNGAGIYQWHLTKSTPMRDEHGIIFKWVGSHTNIAERKQAESAMRLSSLVYQNSNEAMMVVETDGTIININPSFTRITGFSEKEALGKTPAILNSGIQTAEFYKEFWKTLHSEGQWQGELINKRKNGEIYTQWISINSIYKEDGSILHFVALLQDITEQKRNENLIWQQANFDQLTGLPNRRMFLDRLDQAIKTARRRCMKVGLLFLDLDNFKEVNDTLGHNAGDELLKIAAHRLTRSVRDIDTVARLGGDEFVIILGNLTNILDIERIAQLILETLKEPFNLSNEPAYVSASIGITIYPDDAIKTEVLLKNADQAMYESKRSGRDQYSYFTTSLEEEIQYRRQVGNDLRMALKNQQFWLAYQPIIHLASGHIYKAEALLRWNHPVNGYYSPAEFIPIAEETGIINKIGDWVFHQVLKQVKLWREDLHPNFQISINKSPVQFHHPNNSHKNWLECLKHSSLAEQSIAIEITENVLLDANESVGNMLLEYSEAGIDISLDDFGTGYSSLAYLQKYDVDYIKIDQSFISELALHPKKIVLCKSIILMAHELGMKVIGEGIETQEQYDILIAMGCDYGQGYLFSKPVSANEFEILVTKAHHVNIDNVKNK